MKRVGSIWFDTPKSEFESCVVIGIVKGRERCYVLIVQKRHDGSGYERLGVGEVGIRYVSRECQAGQLE
jgi:hypothetical protein